MRLSIVAIAALLVAGAPATSASAECKCLGPNGIVAHHGDTVCLPTPAGLRLARCGMVLNNASWTFLSDSCPEAAAESGATFALRMSLPPEQAIALQ